MVGQSQGADFMDVSPALFKFINYDSLTSRNTRAGVSEWKHVLTVWDSEQNEGYSGLRWCLLFIFIFFL